jgi:hypothetical protein
MKGANCEMSFIEYPNLPTNDVKAVLISKEAGGEVMKILEKRGVEALIVPPCTDIAPQVSAHPDMLFHHLGGDRIIYYRGAAGTVCRRLTELGFDMERSDMPLEPQYPHDIALNAARVGNYLFCNAKYTDRTILNYCSQSNIHIINVRQGYAKCSVCVADDNSIITADSGIAAAARECGINVLLIRSGFINLPGYGSGFVGGCCGKAGYHKMFFCGNISAHPDFAEIKKFLSVRNIEIETLGTDPLCDIGSIIPLTQKD